ncbi:hypothetical protein CC80DRAFT_312463 [Byssothecium circinans]|uniref:Uncharacterized protein n=1 Tax=Byssothecium circinans TaxID=147558 RepID=A0A6A5U7R7_9PLEO|nr:hypothetical protein CC80DRAFT_312463 [Byssothecium circinans]
MEQLAWIRRRCAYTPAHQCVNEDMRVMASHAISNGYRSLSIQHKGVCGGKFVGGCHVLSSALLVSSCQGEGRTPSQFPQRSNATCSTSNEQHSPTLVTSNQSSTPVYSACQPKIYY